MKKFTKRCGASCEEYTHKRTIVRRPQNRPCGRRNMICSERGLCISRSGLMHSPFVEGKDMLKEVLVVEGKMDVIAVRKALDADCIVTGGFSLGRRALADIEAAYKRRGIIILTDPDSAGERIRRFLAKRFPEAKHAFIPKEEATAKGDIGVEQASPESIRRALAKVRTCTIAPREVFTSRDLILAGLSGGEDASRRRARLGERLGVGWANARTFCKRLNSYGVTREEFEAALASLEDGAEMAAVRNDEAKGGAL